MLRKQSRLTQLQDRSSKMAAFQKPATRYPPSTIPNRVLRTQRKFRHLHTAADTAVPSQKHTTSNSTSLASLHQTESHTKLTRN